MLLGLAAYYACMLIPLLGVTQYSMNFSPSVLARIRQWQFAGLGALLASSAGIALCLRARPSFQVVSAALWLSLLSWFVLSTAWSVMPGDTILYSVALAVVLGCGVIYWSISEEFRRRSALLACVAVCGLLAALFLVLPMRPRSLGGITPNVLGHFGLAVLILAYLARSKLRVLAAILAVALVTYSESRTVLISAAVFLFAYYSAAAVRDRQHFWVALFLVFIGGGLAALLGPSIVASVSELSSSALGVNDPTRLQGSGFSGRDRLWQKAFELLEGRELVGYGFRTRGSVFISAAGASLNAHSGLLNAALDVGLIGAVLFAVTYVGSAIASLWKWAIDRIDGDRVATCYLIAMVPLLVVEPNYLNFASPTSFLMILMLANGLIARRSGG